MRSGRQRFREPVWPTWVFTRFSPQGLEFLRASYSELKMDRPVPRATRLSAEDYASAAVAVLRSLGRTDLLSTGP